MVSIIIPTYNRRNLVRYTLNSVDKKHHPGIDLEVILVDDGSTDDTISFVKEHYPNVIVMSSPKKGAPYARNAGLAAAKGKYVVYLDSDDLLGPGIFEKKIPLLENDDSLTACYGDYQYFRSDTELTEDRLISSRKYPLLGKGNDEVHLLNYLAGRYLPPLNIIWRKSFLETIGGHDVTLVINQDVELVIRALLKGAKFEAIQDGTKAYIRTHSIDARVGSASTDDKWQHILDLRRKLFVSLKNSPQHQDKKYYNALSLYLFTTWQSLRKVNPAMSEQFLALSKELYWPVDPGGAAPFKLMVKILGPVNAVKLKQLLK